MSLAMLAREDAESDQDAVLWIERTRLAQILRQRHGTGNA